MILNRSILSELDNYTRLLLLFPLAVISLEKNFSRNVFFLASLAALISLLYVTITLDIPRYFGTSSHSITYGNICALMAIISINRMSESISQSDFRIYALTSLFFIIPMLATATRGPLIGFLICLVLIIILRKNLKLLAVSLTLLLFLVFTSNPMSYRLQRVVDINLFDIQANGHVSIRHRVAYLHYGLEKISSRIIFGIGPDKMEADLKIWIDENQLQVTPRDHLHNEYLDILVKFGAISLALLFFIYFYFFRHSLISSNNELMIILIMLAASQLTQSQFAHHQAITFFMTMLYTSLVSQNNKKDRKNIL